MEGTEQRITLKMKYARKSLTESSSKNQEANSESFVRDTLLQADRQTGKPIIPSQKNKDIASKDTHTFLQEIEELKSKLQQQNFKDLETQKLITDLQRKLDGKQKIIQNQEFQLLELDKVLWEKDKEIKSLKNDALSANKLANESEEKLEELKEAFAKKDCSFDELCDALFRVKEDSSRLSHALQDERAQVTAKTDEISALKKTLSEEMKTEKDLEHFLSVETAKNKKLEEELRFVIKNVNQEKEDLKKEFEVFKEAASLFLENYNQHRDVLLRAVEEGTKHVV